MSCFYKVVYYVCAPLFICCAVATAQTNWYIESTPNSGKVEIYSAKFAGGNELNLSGLAVFGSIRKNVAPNTWVKFELPIGYSRFAAYEYRWPNWVKKDYQNTVLGNPYLGVEFWNENIGVLNRLGIRFPLEESFKGALGGGFSSYDRFDAFQSTYITFSWDFNYMQISGDEAHYRIRGGPLIMFPYRDKVVNDIELFLNLGFDLLLEYEIADICLGIQGIRYMTAEQGISGTTEVIAGFGPNFKFDGGNFGLRINVPLGEELDNFVDFGFGGYFQRAIEE